MRYPLTRAFLALSGVIAMLIGAAILFVPHAFFATNAIELGPDPNLLSEIRAPGGPLLVAGIVMICGAVRKSLLRVALFTTAIVFSMYAVSRFVSIMLDGIPSSSLIGALIIEIVIGAIAAILITRFREARPQS